jgi:hypothetical protein
MNALLNLSLKYFRKTGTARETTCAFSDSGKERDRQTPCSTFEPVSLASNPQPGNDLEERIRTKNRGGET